MGIYIKETGRMAKLMAKEYFVTLRVAFIKGSGLMICSMVLERNYGITIKLCIRENFKMVKKQEKENLNLKVVHIQVILLMDSFMVKENTIFLIQGKFIKDNSSKIN